MEDYRYNDANIIALQLVDVKAAFTQNVVEEMMSYQMRTGIQLLARPQPPYLTVCVSLCFAVRACYEGNNRKLFKSFKVIYYLMKINLHHIGYSYCRTASVPGSCLHSAANIAL